MKIVLPIMAAFMFAIVVTAFVVVSRTESGATIRTEIGKRIAQAREEKRIVTGEPEEVAG